MTALGGHGLTGEQPGLLPSADDLLTRRFPRGRPGLFRSVEAAGSPLAVVDHLGEGSAPGGEVSPFGFAVVPDGDGPDGLVVVWDPELGPQGPGFVVHDPEVDSTQAFVHRGQQDQQGREECGRELLADAAVAMGWIHVEAFQAGHPDGMHAAGAADAPDQMARYLVIVTREQDQVVAIREEQRVVRDAVLGGPAQIGGSGVMRSGVCCEECIDRGDDLREIIGRSYTDPDRPLATLSRREVAQFSSPFSRSGRPASRGSSWTLDPFAWV